MRRIFKLLTSDVKIRLEQCRGRLFAKILSDFIFATITLLPRHKKFR